MTEKRVRRNKKDIIIEKITSIDEKIVAYNQKIKELVNDKAKLENELKSVIEAENKAAKEAEEKDLLSLIKKNNITKEQLQAFIDVNNKTVKTDV